MRIALYALALALSPGTFAANNEGIRSRAEALRDYRGILAKQLNLAEQELKLFERELTLGAATASEFAEPWDRHMKLAAELEAFDGGLIPRQTAPRARSAETKRARDRYRQLLKMRIDFAAKDAEAEQKKYELGASTQSQCIEKRRKLLDLELDLAAFDAGLMTRAR